MTYYAKQIDETGNIIALHTMDRPFVQTEAFVPISQAERIRAQVEAGAAALPEPEEAPGAWERVA